MKKSVLFVCLGNICRSPSAEAVLKAKLKTLGLEKEIDVDSAGTSGYHEGDRADERMQTHAVKRGFNLTSISRQVRPNDYERFDFIIAMDRSNFQSLMNKAFKPEHKQKIYMMTDFSQIHSGDVPDPYYGGSQGFENVLNILEDSVDGLIQELKGKI